MTPPIIPNCVRSIYINRLPSAAVVEYGHLSGQSVFSVDGDVPCLSGWGSHLQANKKERYSMHILTNKF